MRGNGSGQGDQPAKTAAAGNGARARVSRKLTVSRKTAAPRRPVTQKPRRERLVMRRIDPWPVVKLSAVFYVALSCVALVAGVLLWVGTTVTGVRGNVEKFIGDLVVAQDFRLVGWKMLRLFAVASASLVVLGIVANLVMVTLYNLISDLVGGVTVVVEGPAVRPTQSGEPSAANRVEPRLHPAAASNEFKPGPERPLRAGDTGPERPLRAGDTGPERPFRAGEAVPPQGQ